MRVLRESDVEGEEASGADGVRGGTFATLSQASTGEMPAQPVAARARRGRRERPRAGCTLMRGLWVLLVVAGCARDALLYPPAPTAPPEPYPGQLRVSGAGDSWFEAERLPVAEETLVCAGLLDLEGDGRLQVVLISDRTLLRLERTDAGWRVYRYTHGVTTLRLDGRRYFGCAAAPFGATASGRPDIVIAGLEGGVVLRNEGGGVLRSEPLPRYRSAVVEAWTTAAVPIDADGDGDLDLYLGRDKVHHGGDCRFDGAGYVCSQPVRGVGNVFLENRGGAFSIGVSGAETELSNQALAALDLDGDGRQDLFVCNHFGPNVAYLSLGDRTFRDGTAALGLVTGRSACMGVTAGDLDGDGSEDLALSEIGPPSVLLRVGARFRPIGRERGFNPAPQWAWGNAMEDLDNDGDLDLLFAHQLLGDEWRRECGVTCQLDPAREEELLLFRNNGAGYFSAEAPVVLPPGPSGSTSLVVADVDGDGVLDALLVRGAFWDDTPSLPQAWILWGRVRTPGNWLSVDAPQGARVEVCVGSWCRRREVIGGGSFLAMRPNRVHFGLASAGVARVRVEWPRGSWNDLGATVANRLLVFTGPLALGER